MKILGLDIETTGVNVEKGNVLEIGVVGYDSEEMDSLEKINKAPKLTILVYHKEITTANIEALALNKELINEISEYANKIGNNFIENRSFIHQVAYSESDDHEVWLVDNDKATFVLLYWLARKKLLQYTNYFLNNMNENSFIQDIEQRIKQGYFDEDFIKSLKYYIKGLTVAGKNVATFDIPYLRNNLPYFNEIIKIKHRVVDPSFVYTVSSDIEVPNLFNCMSRIGIKSQTAHRAVYDVLDIIYLIYFHFKKSQIRCYQAIDMDTYEIIDSIIVAKDDFDAIKKFKEKYQDKFVADELQLHKLAVNGRLKSFKHELETLETNDPLFVDKDVHVIHYNKDKEMLQKLKDSIKSGKYVVKYNRVFSMQQDTIQVTRLFGKELQIYHNQDFKDIKDLLEADDN